MVCAYVLCAYMRVYMHVCMLCVCACMHIHIQCLQNYNFFNAVCVANITACLNVPEWQSGWEITFFKMGLQTRQQKDIQKQTTEKWGGPQFHNKVLCCCLCWSQLKTQF